MTSKLCPLPALCLVLLVLAGCGKSDEEGQLTAKNPEQAASALDQAFAEASAPVKQDVSLVTEALRKRDFEKAVVSLHAVQQAPAINLQQGMAIHSSSIILERELIAAIERGDAKAKQAYELLKRSRRN